MDAGPQVDRQKKKKTSIEGEHVSHRKGAVRTDEAAVFSREISKPDSEVESTTKHNRKRVIIITHT